MVDGSPERERGTGKKRVREKARQKEVAPGDAPGLHVETDKLEEGAQNTASSGGVPCPRASASACLLALGSES